jgi:phosphoribosyl-ATP pyrophosphohydrolase
MKSFEELFAELSQKVLSADDSSSTALYVNKGVHSIGKKLVEEAAESWLAAEHETKDRTAEELSQLVYHIQCMMLAKEITLEDLYKHL